MQLYIMGLLSQLYHQVQPPGVITSVPYKFQYTPIVIHYVDPVIVVDSPSKDLDKLPLRMVIKAPSSRLPGLEQASSRTTTITLPINQPVKLKLVPSDLYRPQGKYKVDIYSGTNRIPIETMYWVVPYTANPITKNIVHTGSPQGDYIGSNIFSIDSVSHLGTYMLNGEYLVWDTNSPEFEQTYSVTYQPAISLNDLVVEQL